MNSILRYLQSIPSPEGPLPAAPAPEFHRCALCRQAEVNDAGDLCERCQGDQARGYQAISLAGRCRNGAERDSGTLFHAVPLDGWKAVCGAAPGRHSAGWSSWRPEGQAVTCPKCLKKLAKAELE